MHYFLNDTYLDRTFLTQFGLSIKQEGAIGQFGTGLKYAIATILRGHGRITLRTGDDTYVLGTRLTSVRDRPVDIVTASLNGGEAFDLPFNITLGKNWKPWMAFRELYANALDEDGTYTTTPPTREYVTSIEVQWFDFDYIDQEKYFPKEPPKGELLGSASNMQVVRPSDEAHRGHIYYKGMYVGEGSSPYTYLLRSETWQNSLTEDRTIPMDFRILNWSAITLMRSIDEKPHLSLLQTLDNDAAEEIGWLNIPNDPPDAEEIVEAVRRNKLKHPHFHTWAEAWKRKRPPELREPNSREQAIIGRCLTILAAGGITITQTFRISSRDYRGVLGSTDGATIYLEADTFTQGFREVLKTVLEEYAHCVSGAGDNSREMQEQFLNMWVNLYEHLTEEIL